MTQNAFYIGHSDVDSETREAFRNQLHADAGRSEHRAQIAVEEVWSAAVDHQELPQIVTQHATIGESHRR